MKIFKISVCFFFLFLVFETIGNIALAAEENLCLVCHTDFTKPAKSKHGPVKMGCNNCHQKVEGKTHPDQKGSIRLTQEMPGLCFNCHDEALFKAKAIHAPVAAGCTSCHNPHQSNTSKLLVKDIPGLCYNCHDEKKFKGKSGHTNIGMCTGCHSPHSSKINKLLKSEQPELCFSCHEKAKFTKKYVHSIIPTGGCTSCHTPHTSENPSLLLKDNVETLCLECHTGKKDGRHIVNIPGKRVHPVNGIDPSTVKLIKVPDPKRPGKEIEIVDPKNPGKEMNCATCHNPHSSDFRNLFTQKNICARCHKYY
jgi:predicted CXXCH cytochrome family protein